VSEWAVLFLLAGLSLAAALCGVALGWVNGRAYERRRLHRAAVRAAFDPVYTRQPGEAMTTILRRHAKEAAR
jgi:hypothetical protein